MFMFEHRILNCKDTIEFYGYDRWNACVIIALLHLFFQIAVILSTRFDDRIYCCSLIFQWIIDLVYTSDAFWYVSWFRSRIGRVSYVLIWSFSTRCWWRLFVLDNWRYSILGYLTTPSGAWIFSLLPYAHILQAWLFSVMWI